MREDEYHLFSVISVLSKITESVTFFFGDTLKNTDPPDGKSHSTRTSPELVRFIEDLGRYFESYGIPRIGGRILGLLLASHEPLSAETIAKTLRVSRASVSTNFQILLAGGLAEKVTFPGDRTTYFVFPENPWEKTINVEIAGITTMRKIVGQGLSALPEGDKAINRMKEMLEWADFLLQIWMKARDEWQLSKANASVV